MVWMSEDKRFLFLDLETTGLNPIDDRILQLGMVITNRALYEESTFEREVFFDRVVWGYKIDPIVTDMHNKSGLWSKCLKSSFSLADVELLARTWLLDNCFDKGKVVIAGNSVHFDREFIRHQMPDLFSWFSHRIIDVSSLNQLGLRVAEDQYLRRPPDNKAHTTVEDCRGSIEQARYWADIIGKGDAS
jgi:oligoribonuclease